MKAKKIVQIIAKNKSFASKISGLFEMLGQSLRGKYKPGVKNLFIFSFLIVYVLSPIDLIPDFLVGIGFLDDITLTFFALTRLFKEVDKFKEWQQKKNANAALE